MLVIFLDIDGVLNKTFPAMIGQLDPVKVRMLNELVDQTHAEVVITSTWRKLYTDYVLAEKFAQCGLKTSIFGSTPVLEHPGELLSRGMEIGAWLNANPDVEQFVILDDDDDLEPFSDHLVRTDPWVGLTAQKVEECVSVLRCKVP